MVTIITGVMKMMNRARMTYPVTTAIMKTTVGVGMTNMRMLNPVTLSVVMIVGVRMMSMRMLNPVTLSVMMIVSVAMIVSVMMIGTKWTTSPVATELKKEKKTYHVAGN